MTETGTALAAAPAEQGGSLLTPEGATLCKKMDSIVSSGQMQLDGVAGRFERMFQKCAAVQQLRTLLTDEVMREHVLPMMDTPLGFRTDRDPKQIDSKTGRPFTPYPIAVVREALIEALFRGVYPTDNEFNIIAGRCYITKEGFSRLLREYPKLTDIRRNLGLPRSVPEGSVVKAQASWKIGGVEDSIEIEIPVKVNSFMGVDAILGKARRKLDCAIFNHITGSELSDADVDDDIRTGSLPAHAGAPALPAGSSATHKSESTEGGSTLNDAIEAEQAQAVAGDSSAAEDSAPGNGQPDATDEPQGGEAQGMDAQPAGGDDPKPQPAAPDSEPEENTTVGAILKEAAETLSKKESIEFEAARKRVWSYTKNKNRVRASEKFSPNEQQAQAVLTDVKIVVDTTTIR